MATVRRGLRMTAAVGAVAVVAGTTVGIVSAFGEPPPTAGQLLARVEGADVVGLSGTIVHNADLGPPGLDDSRSVRVWYSAPDRLRLAILDGTGETDVIRNGGDVWVWDSRGETARHYRLPDAATALPLWPPDEIAAFLGSPPEAARSAIATLAPSTALAVDGTVTVAGRLAHELVMVPRDGSTLIASVRLSVDAETGVPLRTRVWADDDDAAPELEIAFSRVAFAEPDAANFAFTAPAGVTVTDAVWRWGSASSEPEVIGSGWSAVVSFALDEPLPDEVLAAAGLRRVDGDWGSGWLFASSLATILVTDDGRLLAGAVAPETLYDATAAP